MPATTTQGPVARLLGIIDRILTALDSVLPQAATDNPEAATTTLAAALWLFRVTEGVTHLAAQIAAGIFKPRRPRARIAAATANAGGSGAFPLPRAKGWLARILPHPEPLKAELAALLADPELQPLLGQQPARFGRLLRPLCRAMGLAPPEPLRREPPPAAAPPPPRSATTPSTPPRQGDAALNLFRLVPKASAPKLRSQLALSVFPPVPEFA